MLKNYTILVIFLFFIRVKCLDSSNLLIIILSQKEGYHAAHAELLAENIKQDAKQHQLNPPEVILTHKLGIPGSWTIIPLIPYFAGKYSQKEWFIICTESTVIRLSKLMKILKKYDSRKDLWIGHALYDNERTIIHHFAQHKKKFKYPNIASGFAMTKSLIYKLNDRISKNMKLDNDFSIDISYEFSKFVYESKIRLTHKEEVCMVSSSECATYPKHLQACGTSVSENKIYVAIKTCSKFYNDRIPIIRRTWTKYIQNIGFYSDILDARLPNVYVVPNTTSGHCTKTYAILQHAREILIEKDINWLVVADDDTIMSLGNLLRLLTCYNSATLVALGERYGYRVVNGEDGYDYLTGGAGVVLSKPLVNLIVESGLCACPSSNTPDDMFLFGICFSRINVKPTHIPAFHQARPDDYSPGYLASYDPISFHKFWNLDAEMVYEHYFKDYDAILERKIEHTEL